VGVSIAIALGVLVPAAEADARGSADTSSRVPPLHAAAIKSSARPTLLTML
jgi:hypothetical protein